jgi:putative transposase
MHYYSKKNMSPILGREKFIKWVKERFPKKKKEKEIPESKKLCPGVVDINRAVCRYYEIGEAETRLRSKKFKKRYGRIIDSL